jgi:pSer/pThr/pTyr-binding forkhead associated (FHA) protein
MITLVGSHERCHLHLLSSTVSRHHAMIVTAEDGVYVRDLLSRTHTFVNDEEIRQVRLYDGDRIRIGKFTFQFGGASKARAIPAKPQSLSLAGRSTPINLDENVLLVGRENDCDICIPDNAVSARHAIIFQANGKRYIRDLNSRTGTLLNGTHVHQQELELGDQIRIGELRIEVAAPEVAARPAASAFAAPRPAQVAPPIQKIAPPPEPEPVVEEPVVEAPAPIPLEVEPEPIAEEPPPLEAEPEPIAELPVAHEEIQEEPREESIAPEPIAEQEPIPIEPEILIPTPPAPAAPAVATALPVDDWTIPLQSDETPETAEAIEPELVAEEPEIAPLDLEPVSATTDEQSVAEEPAEIAPIETAPIDLAPAEEPPQEIHAATEEVVDEPIPLAEEPVAELEPEPDLPPEIEEPIAQERIAESEPIAEFDPQAEPVDSHLDLEPHEEPAAVDIALNEPEPAAEVSHATSFNAAPTESQEPEQPIEGLQLNPEDFPPPPAEQEIAPEIESPIEPEFHPEEISMQTDPAGTGIADEVLDSPGASNHATLDLDLDLELPAEPPVGEAQGSMAGRQLGDTEFGHMVEDFTGETSGPLVEESPADSQMTMDEISAEPPVVSEVELTETEITPIPDEQPAASEYESPVVSDVELPAMSEAESIAATEAAMAEELFELPETLGPDPDVEVPAPKAAIPAPSRANAPAVAIPIPIPPVAPLTPPLGAGAAAAAAAVAAARAAFSLSDDFFSADLAASGVYVRNSPTGSPPKSAPAAPKTPAGPPMLEGVGFSPRGDAANVESLLGGTPAQTSPPPQPGQFAKVAVKFDERSGPGGKPRPQGDARYAVSDLPKPPPKAPGGRATPFATKRMGIAPDDDDDDESPPRPKARAAAPNSKPGGTAPATAFDGLGMAPLRDVFSNHETAPVNDAAFGGARLSRGDDYVLPESPEAAARKSDGGAEPDFAEDEFWNRTDEQEGLPPMGIPKPESDESETPAEPIAEETPLELPAEESIQTNGDGVHEEIEPPPTAAPPEPRRKLPPRQMPQSQPKPQRALAKRPIPVSVSRASDTEIPAFDPDATDVPLATNADNPVFSHGNPPPMPPPTVAVPKRPRRKRSRLVPILMLTMIVCMALALGAIWYFVPVKSHVVGSLTYINFEWVPQTNDADKFQSDQRHLLERQSTHDRARDLLQQNHPGTAAGFLSTDNMPYIRVIESVSLNGGNAGGVPQTILQLSADGSDYLGDRQRMGALLGAMIEANHPNIVYYHQQRAIADEAARDVDDATQKISALKDQIAALQRVIDADPAPDEFAALTQKKQDLEKARFDAEDAVHRDEENLEHLQTPATNPSDNSAADPQWQKMHQQVLDLEHQLQDARGQQSAGVDQARDQLEQASKQFNEELAAAEGIVDDGSSLKQFIESAKDAEAKSHELITTLVVDGEDLEQQLQDTRRDVEEMIQSRQQQKWAADPQLQQLQQQLDSAQHRYNAAVGEGIKDPAVLQPLQAEIDDCTTNVKAREAQLGVDPGDVKVADGLNKVIDSLRRKLQNEKDQIDQVLDPLDKQLANLGPQVASLPDAQQNLAKQIQERLTALNDARTNYAQIVAQGQAAPTTRVTELQKQIDDAQDRLERREKDLAGNNDKALQDQLDADKIALQNAKQAYDAVRVQYDDEAGRHEDAQTARANIAGLSEDLKNRSAQIDIAIRDRDQKQSDADHSFDLKPLDEAGDITGTENNPRRDYSLYSIAGLALIFALVAIAALYRESSKAANHRRGEDLADDEQALPV